ncbi:MAG TPA: universal stress protein [Allosphingosinicella sp.]|nr:universal stress protein [Allosphingosinicella sp.]
MTNLLAGANPSESAAEQTRSALGWPKSATSAGAPAHEYCLLACLDDGPLSRSILDHSMAIANALDLSVSVARVIETQQQAGVPADPLEWQVRRRESLDRFDYLIASPVRPVRRVLLSGSAADELTGWATENRASILALGTRAAPAGRAGLGGTVHRMLERGSASLLLVPAECRSRLPYRRLLVPLDGSARAESVLPIAVRIARAHKSELLLAHVVGRPEATSLPCIETTAHALCARLVEQNEQAARDYLDGLEARIWKEGLSARTVVMHGGDARVELVGLAQAQQADLIIVASHGRSGMVEVPCGSVTEYLAAHAPSPLLIVRPSFDRGFAASADLEKGLLGLIAEPG